MATEHSYSKKALNRRVPGQLGIVVGAADAGGKIYYRAADRQLRCAMKLFGIMSISGVAVWLPASGYADSPVANQANEKARVEEVVVTAQKRQERVNKVPVAITAVSGVQLARAGVRDTRDLAKVTAGFTYAETGLGEPVYTLRGVGFYDQSLSSTPAVSVYNDEVPLTYPAETRGQVLDLSRVEVLKGPQGTLFGQNATGGAVNYIANKPTNDFHYGVDVGYARFDQFDLAGFVSGSITNNLTSRLAIQTTQSTEGWQKSYTRDETLGRINKTLFRWLTDWTPNDRLKVALNVNGWFDKSDTQAAQLVALDPNIPAKLPYGYAHYPFSPHNDQAADWDDFNGKPARDEHYIQTNLRADYRLTDTINLTSISSFDYLRGHSNFDDDGIDQQAFDYTNNNAVNTEYQELRLTGTIPRFNWILGANYEHDATTQVSPFLPGYSSLAVPAPGTIIDEAGIRSHTDSDTYAVFANVEYKLLDNLKLTGGIRYNHDTHEGQGCGYVGPDNGFGGFFDYLSNLLSGGVSHPNVQAGDCYTLGSAPSFLPALVNLSLNEHNVSWRTALSWNYTPDILLYTSVSKGYKGGGLPAIGATVVASLAPYKQESVLSYEAGAKATLFDRRVQLNGDGFYYNYSNKQILGNYLDEVFGVQPVIVNIPRSRLWGLEGQLITKPLTGLSLSAAADYLNSRIQRYTGYDTLAAYGSYAGTPLPFTPTWTATTDAEYDWPITDRLGGFFGGDVLFNSRTNAGIGDVQTLTIAPYALLDLRAGVQAASGRWIFTLYGNNVTDKYYWSTVVHAQDGIVRYTGRPAMYGFKLSFRM